ncbi:MAG TPA: beta-ketoacyl-[acyl-carrier-protein] synthase family protein [Armatimonadetes bacterium]|nr:beta-ketoacyl-[acyl-carrier-protein] synthase family protein [Armatimonadota bacterium]
MPGERKRVVITGLGAICALGNSVAEFWRNLTENRSGLKPITRFDPTGLRNHLGGEVTDFDFSTWGLGSTAGLDRAAQFALAAAAEAWRDAGLERETPAAGRGAVFSTNFGGASSWEGFVETGDPAAFAAFDFHAAAGRAIVSFGLTGPVVTLSNACSSGTNALGYAADLIRHGQAEVMLAGGHDALSLSALSGLSALRTITTETIRPFDRNRSGTLFGEGSGMVVLESWEHAQGRGVPIYAEVLGYAANNNAYHLTAPDRGGEGMRLALRRALADAGLAPEEVDYVNAHATGTPYHDLAETQAIKAVLGPHAYRIPISSLKAATGHVMAAAGALEAIACVLALRDGIVPPTLNYQTPDPECDLEVVPNRAQRWEVNVVLSLSAGLGGNNAALVLGKHLAVNPGA